MTGFGGVAGRTLPWCGKGERRCVLYRYSPKTVSYSENHTVTTLPPWVDELTPAQRAVLVRFCSRRTKNGSCLFWRQSCSLFKITRNFLPRRSLQERIRRHSSKMTAQLLCDRSERGKTRARGSENVANDFVILTTHLTHRSLGNIFSLSHFGE